VSNPAPFINIAVEGVTDETVVTRILQHIGLTPGLVRGRRGKADLLKLLPNYNQAASFANWLVVIDLDQDADCAPIYQQTILPNPSRGMMLRVAVREIEAWLLADREHLAAFLGIAVENVPANPDAEIDPKNTLISLARRCRKTALREDIVPREGSGAKVGPGYVSRILEFILQSEHRWRPEVAAEHSDSLRRCIEALQNWDTITYD
jgi:hypothetical protein